MIKPRIGSGPEPRPEADPTKWFVTGTTFLDPRVDANKAAIEANIQASLDAFEDDDKSGHENHGGDGSGHQ